ncbi:MAG: ShlB/FhaC/HecB family hemolysin secretion/activation protein, partial [Gloeomargarita sp. GMQP_bins_14]
VAALNQVYAEKGFVTSRVELQAFTDGVLIAEAIEPRLEAIEIEGLRGTRPSYVRSRLELANPVGGVLNPVALDDALRLLANDPVFEEVRGSLGPGSTPNQSILQVRVKEARRVGGSFEFNNYSPPGVGSERYEVTLLGRSLTGQGDILSLLRAGTLRGGSETMGLSYRIPVNPQQGMVSVRYNRSEYRIIQEPFDVFNFRGVSELVEASYRQPLFRNPREEFALSWTYTFQQGQTFIFNNLGTPFGIGPDEKGRTTTHVLRFGQDYLRRDRQGVWVFNSVFNVGIAGTQITEPDAHFFSWTAQGQRLQVITPNVFLLGILEWQLAADPLLGSQQFSIGGGQSVRGYRQSVRSADNGLRLSLETRFTPVRETKTGRPVLQLASFVDVGKVWNNPNNPNPLPDRKWIAGIGGGVIWEPVQDFVIRLDGAGPFVKLQDRGDNLQERAFYFSVGYRF